MLEVDRMRGWICQKEPPATLVIVADNHGFNFARGRSALIDLAVKVSPEQSHRTSPTLGAVETLDPIPTLGVSHLLLDDAKKPSSGDRKRFW